MVSVYTVSQKKNRIATINIDVTNSQRSFIIFGR